MREALNAGVRRAIRMAGMLYGAVWLACLALYWGSLATGGLGGGAIMDYTLFVLYVVLPVAGVVASFLAGHARGLGGMAAPVPSCVRGPLPHLHRRDVRPLDGARPRQHRPPRPLPRWASPVPARSPGSSSEWSSTRARGQGADAASAPGLAPQLHAPASRRIPHSADVSGDVALLARRRPRSRLARCLAGRRARRAHPNGVRRARRPHGTPGSGALPGRARLCRRGHGPRRPYLRRVRHEAPCHEHPPQARSQRRRDRGRTGTRHHRVRTGGRGRRTRWKGGAIPFPRRALLYLAHKRGKTLMLLALLFTVAVLALTSCSIRGAAQTAQLNVPPGARRHVHRRARLLQRCQLGLLERGHGLACAPGRAAHGRLRARGRRGGGRCPGRLRQCPERPHPRDDGRL